MLIAQYKLVYILQKFHSNFQDLLHDADFNLLFSVNISQKTYVRNELQNLQKTFHHLEFENLLAQVLLEIYKLRRKIPMEDQHL